MKFLIFFFLTTVTFSQDYADKHEKNCDFCDDRSDFSFKDLDIDGGELTIQKHGRDRLVILKDGTLFVKGEKVETTNEQRKMLKAYVKHLDFVIEEGIAIGLKGADIGITAAVDVVSALFTFDFDEMDRKLDKMDKKIEKKAARLEAQADVLDYHADEFSAVRCFLKREIRELDRLREF